MESFIQQIAEYGEQILQFSWLPLMIWTVLSFTVWLALRLISNVHPQYQYHSRLAILFALPAGFVIIGLIQFAGSVLSTPPESLSLISVTTPFEITVSSGVTSASVTKSTILYSILFLLFSGGLFLFTAKSLLQWSHLIRLKSKCDFLPLQIIDNIYDHNLDLIKETDKQIRISFLEEEIIPVTFGITNPVILLPDSLKTDQDKLNLVLRHELTHITQNDYLSNITVSLIQIIFWFHPFVYVLKKELIDYREIRCDSLVLSNQSVSRKKYASLLLELLPMPNINKELSVNMAQESSNLKKRIQMITQQKPNRPIPKRSSIAIFAFIIMSTAIAMSCTDMQTQGEETSSKTIQTQSQKGDYYEVVEEMPELIGGIESIQEKVIYPEEARKNGIEGQVFVKFIVNKDGIVENAEIMRGIGGGADEEALRVVRHAKFEPGYQNGEPVRVQYALPIAFRLSQPEANSESDHVFKAVEEMPQLKGGLEEITKNIRYPEKARQAGIEGRVYVQFIVNKEGNVENAKVTRGIGGGADEEALRVLRQAKFTPGYIDGEPVRVQYSLPIFFQLSQNDPQQ